MLVLGVGRVADGLRILSDLSAPVIYSVFILRPACNSCVSSSDSRMLVLVLAAGSAHRRSSLFLRSTPQPLISLPETPLASSDDIAAALSFLALFLTSFRNLSTDRCHVLYSRQHIFSYFSLTAAALSSLDETNFLFLRCTQPRLSLS